MRAREKERDVEETSEEEVFLDIYTRAKLISGRISTVEDQDPEKEQVL